MRLRETLEPSLRPSVIVGSFGSDSRCTLSNAAAAPANSFSFIFEAKRELVAASPALRALPLDVDGRFTSDSDCFTPCLVWRNAG
jgi:hypothetical protein